MMRNILTASVLLLTLYLPGWAQPVLKPQPEKFGSLLRAQEDKVPATIEFVNRGTASAQVYAIDDEGKRRGCKTLRAGEKLKVETFLTHPWEVTTARGVTLGIYLPVKGDARVVVKPR